MLSLPEATYTMTVFVGGEMFMNYINSINIDKAFLSSGRRP